MFCCWIQTILVLFLYIDLKVNKTKIETEYSVINHQYIMSSLVAQSNMSSKLFIENYKILQDAPENKDNRPSHNYHSVDLVTSSVNKPNFEKFLLALNIDRSGSMGTRDKSGKTPLEFTLHTVKCLIDYLNDIKKDNPEIKIKILLNAFDDKQVKIGVHEIGKDEDSKLKYIEKINSITPRGSTNIEGAFQAILHDELYLETSDITKAHILFTDGKPNIGRQSATGITSANPGGKQIYIGYGSGHDSKLLQDMSKLVKGEYHFVDNIENAGMVYGEIIHSLLFESVRDIKVTIKGAEAYDFEYNVWSKHINFNSFSSEHSQTLILRSNWDSVEPISVNVIYTETCNNITHCKTDIFSEYNCTNGESKENTRNLDVEKQIYRQKTMEILSKALNRDFTDVLEFKEHVIVFEKGLKEFMKNKNLEDDPFMLKLVSDIYIAFTGIDSYSGNAFIGSRLIAQGCQRAYQVSDLSSLRQPAESQMRFRSASLQRNNGVDECSVPDTLLAVPKAMRQTSCYTTPSQQRTMRSLSQPIDGGDAN